MLSIIRNSNYRGGCAPWGLSEGEISRLFGPLFADRIPVEIDEDKDNAYVRAELPGVDRKDISVELANGCLTIGASRKSRNADGEESVSLERTVCLSEGVQADKVVAAYENGVLTVTVPKKEESKPRKITVEVRAPELKA